MFVINIFFFLLQNSRQFAAIFSHVHLYQNLRCCLLYRMFNKMNTKEQKNIATDPSIINITMVHRIRLSATFDSAITFFFLLFLIGSSSMPSFLLKFISYFSIFHFKCCIKLSFMFFICIFFSFFVFIMNNIKYSDSMRSFGFNAK